MSRQQVHLFKNVLVLIDVCVSVLAFVVTFFFRQWLAVVADTDPTAPTWLSTLGLRLVTESAGYEALLPWMVPAWALALYSTGTADFRASYRQMLLRYAQAVAIGLALMVTVAFLLKLQFVARSFVVLFGVLNLLFLMSGRFALLETIGFVRSKRVDGHRLLVVGTRPQSVAYAQSLATTPPWNIKTIGHVAVPGERLEHVMVPVLGQVERLDLVLDAQPVDEVLFAAPDLSPELLASALNACDERGVDVLMPLPAAIPARGQAEIASLEGFDTPLLSLRRTPSGEVRLAIKRLTDIVGALVGITLSGPIMIALALAIKIESRGPVMFRQTRAGRNGRKFTMLKFRSMVVDAERKKAELMHLNEMSGPVFKIRKDPRITRVGAFIRKTSLDELPQFFNILFGDMSLVGPRPPLPSEVDQYKPWQRRRLSVKPGLTGLWQVSGRNNIDFEEWMRLDLRYIDDWSLWLDAKILMKTLPAVIFKTGAS
jgi:exopolysaccharide biosynthesis polyprenyl glycosylphosphotransferase